MAGRTRTGVWSGGRRRLATGAALAALLMVAATACGGDGKGAKDSAAGGVRGALDRVADTPDTRTWFTYADLAGLRAANGDAGRLGPYAQIAGLAEDGKFADLLPPVYGFDPRDADRTWTAGAAPKQATVLSGGLRLSVVEERLAAAKAAREHTASAGTQWRTAPDYQISLETAAVPEALAVFNVVRVDGATLVHGGGAAEVAAADTGKGRTLGDAEPYKSLAACLGDVLAAEIAGPRPDGGGTAPIAVGFRGAKGRPVTQVLCLPGSSAQDLDRVREFFAPEHRLKNGMPWGEAVSDIEVAAAGGAVRVTAVGRNDRFRIFDQALQQGEFAELAAAAGGP
ncbi:hypothetical protein ACPA54_11500 [Uniformispora flossi]|uniref:hypothetical protein n=1 Tax=Uniformispora flossi TaxID=3390723 RepID=UPI003C2C6CEA